MTDETFTSDPATGTAHDFSAGSPELVDRGYHAVEEVFWTYGHSNREARAAFFDQFADELDARAEMITQIGTQETGERGRTTGKLRPFAAHIRAGDYLDRRHDEALPDRQRGRLFSGYA